jgi:hypothetical protein
MKEFWLGGSLIRTIVQKLLAGFCLTKNKRRNIKATLLCSLTSSWLSPAAELNKSSVSMITKQKIKIQMLLVKPSNFPPQEFSCFEFSFRTAALSRLPPKF